MDYLNFLQIMVVSAIARCAWNHETLPLVVLVLLFVAGQVYGIYLDEEKRSTR